MKSLNQIMQGIALVGQLDHAAARADLACASCADKARLGHVDHGCGDPDRACDGGREHMEHRAAASDEKGRGKRKKRRLLQRTYLIEVDYEA